jgi:hypothetical protein
MYQSDFMILEKYPWLLEGLASDNAELRETDGSWCCIVGISSFNENNTYRIKRHSRQFMTGKDVLPFLGEVVMDRNGNIYKIKDVKKIKILLSDDRWVPFNDIYNEYRYFEFDTPFESLTKCGVLYTEKTFSVKRDEETSIRYISTIIENLTVRDSTKYWECGCKTNFFHPTDKYKCQACYANQNPVKCGEHTSYASIAKAVDISEHRYKYHKKSAIYAEPSFRLYRLDQLEQRVREKLYEKWKKGCDSYDTQRDAERCLNNFLDLFLTRDGEVCEWSEYDYGHIHITILPSHRDMTGKRLYSYINNNTYAKLIKWYEYTANGKSRLSNIKMEAEWVYNVDGHYMDYDIMKPLKDYLAEPDMSTTLEKLLYKCCMNWLEALWEQIDDEQSYEVCEDEMQKNEEFFFASGLKYSKIQSMEIK